MNTIKKVSVIGAGTMGRGIAQVNEMAGIKTTIIDVGDSWDSLSECDLVIEAVFENLDLKRELFTKIDREIPPHAIMASNTSSLSISKIAQSTLRPQNVVGLHFFNPPTKMKLLEIVRGKDTSDDIIIQAQNYAAQIGKTSITVKDSPGFATSRLGICLGNEAMRMLEEGVASADDIDVAMMLGYGHPIGPLKLTDLVGLDVRLAIGEYLFTELRQSGFNPPAILREKVARGELGKKSGRGFYNW